jgi:hypothetical protein
VVLVTTRNVHFNLEKIKCRVFMINKVSYAVALRRIQTSKKQHFPILAEHSKTDLSICGSNRFLINIIVRKWDIPLNKDEIIY